VLRHVVAIGASAGGLEALQAFVGALEAGGTTAYVVAQHLAPEHRSLIVDLLARATRLPVIAASDGRRLSPDVICVVPPRHDVVLEHDVLRIREPEARFGPSPCVDLLFDSLADHWKEHGVAVVLSGTGSDGARGLRAVRAAGGLTIAQTPASAKFDGMPSAAISIGGADLILEPAQIGPRISALLGSGVGWIAPPRVAEMPVNLATITAQLKHDTGIDFSEYKESTLRRQVQRRMAIRQIAAIDDYLPLLASDPEESRALLQNLLVTVTSFFRDPQAFDGLKTCLAAYLEQREQVGPVRVWVPGCATGEEVYSLADGAQRGDGPSRRSGRPVEDLRHRPRRAQPAGGASRHLPGVGGPGDSRRAAAAVRERAGGRAGDPRAAAGLRRVRQPQRGPGSALPPARPRVVPQHADLLHRADAGAGAALLPLQPAAGWPAVPGQFRIPGHPFPRLRDARRRAPRVPAAAGGA